MQAFLITPGVLSGDSEAGSFSHGARWCPWLPAYRQPLLVPSDGLGMNFAWQMCGLRGKGSRLSFTGKQLLISD